MSLFSILYFEGMTMTMPGFGGFGVKSVPQTWTDRVIPGIVSGSCRGDGPVQCVTTCQSDGGCEVKIVNGPPGKLSGSCFPPDFGGSCTGIPDQCVRGSQIAQQCGSPCKAGTRNV